MVLLYEYEIKIKVENLEKIRNKLQEMNANFLGVIEESDVYFLHPCRDFRRTDEALRVRIYNDKLELTYKGPKISDKIKAREEINIELRHEDLQKIVELLEKLGFKKFLKVKKRREVYRIGGFEVNLDSIEDLGDFIEVELKSACKDEKEASNMLTNFVEKLGLEPKSILKSYLELLIERLRN